MDSFFILPPVFDDSMVDNTTLEKQPSQSKSTLRKVTSNEILHTENVVVKPYFLKTPPMELEELEVQSETRKKEVYSTRVVINTRFPSTTPIQKKILPFMIPGAPKPNERAPKVYTPGFFHKTYLDSQINEKPLTTRHFGQTNQSFFQFNFEGLNSRTQLKATKND